MFVAISGTVTYYDIFRVKRTTAFRLKVPFVDGEFTDGEMVPQGYPNWST